MLITTTEEANDAPVGGKAANLFRMKAMGFNVPRFAVIPGDAAAEHDKELIEALGGFFGTDQALRFAVRSSALDEDGAQHSFAGQFETFLFVPLEEVPEKFRAVRASASSERARAYRRENGLPLETGIGVVIQEMVAAEKSGVAFGSDPTTGDPDTRVISALFGLGDGLVSGELDADSWHVRPRGIEARIVRKEHMVVRDPNGSGTMIAPVDPLQSAAPSLSDAEIATITKALEALQRGFGTPQDIEFAFAKGDFFLLQARPITTLKPRGEYTLWDNSNIIESYPGVTTPLTFSFIIKMYEAVYIRFCDLLGVDKATIAKHHGVFANTLGLVRGRVYYNLLNWYKMLAMVPGYRLNARFMENMMGVKERFELKEEFRMSKAAARWRIMKMVFRMMWLQWRLPAERRKFQRHLDATMERYAAIDFNTIPAEAIIEHYRVFERTLLREWKAPMINDFFAMIWFGVLQKLCKRWVPRAPNLHNDLLCGSRDIISTGPIHACMAIAKAVGQDAEAKAFVPGNDPAAFLLALREGRFPAIKPMVDDYLHRFGERCVGELKLETVSHAQDPTRFLGIVRSYVEQGITQARERSSTDDGLRKKAENALSTGLWGKPLKRWLLKWAMRKARDLVSARENLRFERTRGFGMVRRMFTALGARLVADGTILDARDVFYLELAELLGSGNRSAWKSKIAERRATFAGYAHMPPPSERFYTYGNDFNDAAIRSTEKITPMEDDLRGVGCCPGIVQGRVRKVLDPTTISSLDGDILVTASTDPGWVTLFPSCSAILVERGSLLSHSAIVSREMGIPCIVSVPGLLRTLDTGDLVRMDGSTGVIELIKKVERAST